MSASDSLTRRYFNLDEAASAVGLKNPSLRAAIRRGELAYCKPGRAYLVRLEDVHVWLDDQLRKGGIKLVKEKAA